MAPTKYVDRTIPKISLKDFSNRIEDITTQLIVAADSDGFFALVDHGIPISTIDKMFTASESFFSLPDTVKATVAFSSDGSGGWDTKSQIRPSTGFADQKESYQLQHGSNTGGRWLPESELPGFNQNSQDFMKHCQTISEKLMLCFARGLGFPDEYFIEAHDIGGPNAQTALRLLYYFEVDSTAPVPEDYYRAGAHTDWDVLTLLFQKGGQSGLEICPGREAVTDFGAGDTWTKVEPAPGEIICNIGDLLMSWSDDRFKSTLHRVATPSVPETDYFGPRYSIGYFNVPRKDCNIQGPLKKYPMITGEEFMRNCPNRPHYGVVRK